MNRTDVLRIALPKIIDAANESPPIQISILDYSSTDGLDLYLQEVVRDNLLVEGNSWKIIYKPGKKYYNSTNARNIVALSSDGDYLVMLSAEALPAHNAFVYIRSRIEENIPVWMCEGYSGRWIICRRDEFIESGGYDERFDVYAPEDRDICNRLHRRGGKFEQFSPKLINEIPTPNKDKLSNLDTSRFTGNIWIKRQMHREMAKIYEENNLLGILVANEGVDWGK